MARTKSETCRLAILDAAASIMESSACLAWAEAACTGERISWADSRILVARILFGLLMRAAQSRVETTTNGHPGTAVIGAEPGWLSQIATAHRACDST